MATGASPPSFPLQAGERLGPGAPKAIREIAGTPMLVYAVKALAASPVVDVVVVAAPSDYREDVGSLLQPQEFSAEVFVVAGENLDRNLSPGH